MLINDGSKEAPTLKVYANADTFAELGSDSIWPGFEGDARDALLREHGFDGIQLTNDLAPGSRLLSYCGLDRINAPAEADVIAAKHAGRGDLCITVHAGWGIEDDTEVSALVESIMVASDRHHLPIFIETHRATITQDLWRTVKITERHPEVRFNGDFSHYYCGQELAYGDWEAKLNFMTPIFSRIGFLHGRISSGGCMQVPIDADIRSRPKQAHGSVNYLAHFREMWIRAMLGFLQQAQGGDVLVFAPELLSGKSYYARLFADSHGILREETDRYAQALSYKELARNCFVEAQERLKAEASAHAL